jgi:multiple sugar transport system substrate-binding protein
MLSDGYPRWLALSPQGKYPVRIGDGFDPERYAKAWARLQSGAERKAPLRRFYSPESIESLADGVLSFRRWAFEQGQAALLGALRGPRPVAKALDAAIRGDIDPDTAARQAQAAVERVSERTR